MRKLNIILFVSLVLTSVANAQEYNKFKLGLGVGYAGGKGTGVNDAGGGVFLTFEPAYRLNDELAIGLRLEAAVYGEDSDGWPEITSSITINGQYYFSYEQFRPFVGAGLGIYFPPEFSTFGFYPRIGFDFGHFTLALEYNFINSGSNAYYLGVRVGGFFFGSKK